MKHIFTISFCLIIGLFMSGNLYSQSGWFPLSSGTYSNLYSCSFSDVNTGYVVGDAGIFLKTTNGGINWSINTYIADGYLRSVCFINTNTGYICGDSAYSSDFIWKTTNGGVNWSRLYQTSQMFFYSIYFYNLNTGYTAASNGFILRTSNGGINWSQISIGGFIPVTSIIFPTSDTGYLTSGILDLGGAISKSTNAGLNWSNINTTSIPLNSVYFLNSSTGYAVGGQYDIGPLIVKTINGGTNWQTQVSPQNYDVYTDIVFTDTITGYCSGHGILKTTNKGINWNYQINSYNSIYKLSMLNSSTGYAVGGNGTILKTTTGGDPVGIKPISNEIPKSFSLYQNYPNPFNPTTKIKFDVTSNVKREMSNVKLIVYDILGREAASLVNEELKPGSYEYEWDGSGFASGVYFYRLTTGDASSPDGIGTGPLSITKKMVLLR